jgi:hypothetical protein
MSSLLKVPAMQQCCDQPVTGCVSTMCSVKPCMNACRIHWWGYPDTVFSPGHTCLQYMSVQSSSTTSSTATCKLQWRYARFMRMRHSLKQPGAPVLLLWDVYTCDQCMRMAQVCSCNRLPLQ